MMDEPAKTKREVTFSRLLGFRELGIIIFIVLISVLIGIRNPRFLTWSNFHDILIDTAALSVLSVGMMLVLVTGGIDLSMESVLALTGMVAGMMVKQNPSAFSTFYVNTGIIIGGRSSGIYYWFDCS